MTQFLGFFTYFTRTSNYSFDITFQNIIYTEFLSQQYYFESTYLIFYTCYVDVSIVFHFVTIVGS